MMAMRLAEIFLFIVPFVSGGVLMDAPMASSGSAVQGNIGMAAAIAPMPPMLGMPPMPPMFEAESNEQQFKRADADKNGKLNFGEFIRKDKYFIQAKQNEFSQFDTNSDGFISEKEHRQYYQKIEEENKKQRYQYLSGIFQEFDEDHDRKLSPNELKRMLRERYSLKPKENFAKVFAKFDTKKNGALDMDEFEFFERNIPYNEMDFSVGPMPMPVAMSMPASGPMPMPMPMQMPMSAKVNQD